jgi:outer membrane protein assembly factor BamB
MRGSPSLHCVRWLIGLSALFGLAACYDDHEAAQTAPSNDERQKYFNETSTNWSMMRGYPRGTAYNPYERELNAKTVGDLHVLWQTPSGSYPLIQSGERLVASHVTAVNAADGGILWTDAGAVGTRSGVVCKGAVYQTYDGIRGVNLTTGIPRVDIDRREEDATSLFGVAVAKGSALVFPVLFKDWAALGGAETTTYRVFDVVTKILGYLNRGFVSLAPAAITSGKIYVPGLTATTDREVVHWDYSIFSMPLDPADAAAGWSTPIDEDVEAKAPETSVAVIGGRVYAVNASGREVVAIDQKSGKLLWRAQTDSVITTLGATFDFVYVAGARTDKTSVLQAFSTANGGAKFSTSLGQRTLVGQLAIGGDVVYIGSNDGQLSAVSALDGLLLQQIKVGGSVSNPVVARGRVFVATGESIVSLGVAEQLGPAVEPPGSNR